MVDGRQEGSALIHNKLRFSFMDLSKYRKSK